MIKDGSHVVIIDNSQNRRVTRVKSGQKQIHFKTAIDCDLLIGKSFNSFFEVTD